MVDKLENITASYQNNKGSENQMETVRKYDFKSFKPEYINKLPYKQMPRSVEYDCDCGDGSNCDY